MSCRGDGDGRSRTMLFPLYRDTSSNSAVGTMCTVFSLFFCLGLSVCLSLIPVTLLCLSLIFPVTYMYTVYVCVCVCGEKEVVEYYIRKI
mmetsp:Transcript_9328/g.9076  ORF Transcript_9328/g.9076 Transcript_9328/m.9076 type:complete len:90 (-) Transcript_9328:56-325(-)